MSSDWKASGFNERIVEASLKRGSKVVLALDFAGPYGERLDKAVRVLDKTKEYLAAVKVNHHLLLPFGLQGIQAVIDTCKDEGLPLIADLKMNDIESTNMNIVDALLDYGFDAVIANPFVGREEGLGKVIERVHSKKGGILLLVYMSHKGADEGYSLRLEGGEPLYRVFAERAKIWGADGVIVSAKSAERIAETRQIVGSKCLIFSPGVGAQGGDATSGISAGANFVLVGRAITESHDPAKIAAQLQSS
ncbi:MAG: orotidine-5'-phosphate decarboxylase [Nitrososphaerota archaeon]|jgi:orotidine-5'-phosphate decarboxylase|nr:orotidine-5'-phosphate decarboxylase [Nitrososphaerota archaeon]MDG6942914.1 orotidine-5'-phosphate decarboxylase [Nitrososphaerota archaeon]